MRSLFGSILGALLFAGCVLLLGDDGSVAPARQPLLFEVEYANFAWIPTRKGLYVDGQGRVYRYDASEAAWRPARDDAFTEAELRDKYRHRQSLLRIVPPGELAEKAALIEPAARGPFSEPVSVCRDAGTLSFTAFRFDAEAGLYTPVLLYVQGDWAQENRSPSARVLYGWLRSFDPDFDPDWGCGP